MRTLFNYDEPNDSLPMSMWNDEDKPSNKLLKKGTGSMSDAELLSIILKGENSLDLAMRVLSSFNNELGQLAKASVSDLLQLGIISGKKRLSEAQATAIVTTMEIGRRRMRDVPQKRTRVSSSKDIYELMAPKLMDLPHEEFWIIMLNRANDLIDMKQLSIGGITGTVADMRMIFEWVVKCKCVNLILCHNHPSGNNKPSGEDIRLTKKAKEASAIFEMNLLDHLIVAHDKYYSFADEGMI